jgi:hypothetical protein
MNQSSLEVASDFARRWGTLPKERRARLGKQIPVAAVQEAALSHPDVEMRRFFLFLLDHYASDVSSDTFRRALHDPVASVRENALHGLACETCRHDDVCVPDVVTDLVKVLASDSNAEVRYKSVAALARFIERDTRSGQAIARAASSDADPAIRAVAQTVVDTGQPHVRRRKAALRDVRRASRRATVTVRSPG